MSTYSKQYLHSGEEEYASAGTGNGFLFVKGFKVALAICADFTNAQHQDDAIAENADVYLVSALISDDGFEADAERLSDIAVKTKMPVLLSNFVGESGGWHTGGRSGVWNTDGQCSVLSCRSREGFALCELTSVSTITGRFFAL